MVVRRRKKNVRMRGTRTQGWGGRRKRRGGGHRGGRGNAGSGKRADAKKPSYWMDPDYMGKKGFVKKNKPLQLPAISIKTIERHLTQWKNEQKIKEEQSYLVIDLSKIGYGKLLGTGKATRKMKITVATSAPKAVEKVQAAGGEVVLLKKD
ncbi:uL15 family ribosomal protein [Candidatus Woesearchaeota archaeon]|nr:uL15 family ribosomal protein [Candidatus Woesearchaeota archaeon]